MRFFKYRQVAFGFIFIILVMAGTGLLSLVLLKSIASDMDKLYRHPFSVSQAAKNINFHLVSMHRYMKDVVLAQTHDEIELAINEVSKHEEAALENFNTVSERFLGEKSQIKTTLNTFRAWKPIREEVIKLVRENKKLEASIITKNRGAKHVSKLNREVDAFVEFASNKAYELHEHAKKDEEQSFWIGSGVFFFSTSLVAVFLFYVWRNLSNSLEQRLQHNHLIDQNIMMATLDENGVVLEISSALCRFLECLKKDVINKPSQFFDNSGGADDLTNTILRTVQTGKEWKGEIQHHLVSGEIHWASSSVIPNFDKGMQITGLTNILIDETGNKLSHVDKLTSLLNRRRYDEVIVQEIRIAKRNGHDLTLAILDIDFFKNYNDLYGHPKGDEVLSDISNTLMSCLRRPDDSAFRLGGEEFAVIFSRQGVRESKDFLEVIRAEIEGLCIEHGDSSVSKYVTVSIGSYVLHPKDNIGAAELYIEADKALYVAKEKRNTVELNS